jgi:hypothetical protein
MAVDRCGGRCGAVAIKGLDVAEIAALRGSAQGTVRAQLTRIYAKAGTTSQTGLIALFMEELIDPASTLARRCPWLILR